MKILKIKLKNKEGLHARPASRLVELCHLFKSSILISFDAKKANAANITEVLSLGVENGDSIEVEIKGRDEEKAYKELKAFFNARVKEIKNY